MRGNEPIVSRKGVAERMHKMIEFFHVDGDLKEIGEGLAFHSNWKLIA
jgi:hypothetical protein